MISSVIKGLLRLTAVLAVFAAASGAVLWLYIDRVAASALTRGIGRAGDVACEVRRVGVSLVNGTIEIDALAVKNPAGYPPAAMFDVGGAHATLASGTLWSRPIHVKELRLVRPAIRLEAGVGGSNIKVYLENVARNLRKPDGTEDAPTRLIVDRLVLSDGVVRVGSGFSTMKLMDIEVASAELTDIRGRDGAGATIGELTAMVVLEMLRRGAATGDINLHALVPPQLMAGLRAVLDSTSIIFQGVTDIWKSPMKTFLRSLTRPTTQP